MKLYEELCEMDLINPVRGFLDRGLWTWNEQGKIEVRGAVDSSGKWVFHGTPEDRNCGLWLQIIFRHYEIIPTPCLSCWKVVARPTTLKEVMGLMKLQNELFLKEGWPGKVGMDIRPFTANNYWGAFWWLPLSFSQAQAVERKRAIEKRISEEVGMRIPVILKRACTEMENKYGPTDKWNFGERRKQLSDLLEGLFDYVVPGLGNNQPAPLKTHIVRRWIDWAWEHGDDTVWEFAEKESFFPAPVNYDDRRMLDA